MADSRLALEEYSKNVPPGWEPHIPNYPLRLYEEKFNLWRNLVKDDFQAHQMGSLMVGRLKGAANRLALKITLVLANGETLTGPPAVASPAQDPLTQQEIFQLYGQAAANLFPDGYPGSKSGCDLILDKLRGPYGPEDTNIIAQALDRFFGLARHSRPLIDFCIAYKIRSETAESKAGLAINSIGKTHLFLTKAGLSGRFIDDIMLKVDNDRTKFEDIYNIVARTAKNHQNLPDEELRHLLYMEDENEVSNIEYFTDNTGAWYIWDHDLRCAWYLEVDEEENYYTQEDITVFWAGVCDNEEYEDPSFCPGFEEDEN